MKRIFIFLLSVIVVVGCLAAARVPQNYSATIADLEQQIEAQRKLLADWAGLIRYGSEDTELPKPKPDENRVVFLGDELTENWGSGAAPFFTGKPYLNRQDVIKLNPKVVVIQIGSNDLASVTGPITQQMFAENVMSIVELAKFNNIKVVLASMIPICDCYKKQSVLRPFGKIIGMNGWLKEYAEQSGSVFLDYYSALAEGRNLKKEFTNDGVYLNDAGYAVMAPLAEKAIVEAMNKK
jgi:acyl-CoA thioesterase I